MADKNRPVLVGVDGSQHSIDALRYAAGIATAMDAPLRVVTTWEFRVLGLYYPPDEWTPETDAVKVLNASIAQAFDGAPPARLMKELLEGPTAKTLIEESKHSRILVLGARGAGGFARLRLGSVGAACASHAHCPVLLVHTPDFEVDDNAPIVVGVDGSEPSIGALRYASELATAIHAPLRVVTMWENPMRLYYPHYPSYWDPEANATKVLETSIARAFEGKPPAGLADELVEGPSAKSLIEQSKHARMLVLGTRGAGGFSRLVLGSVSATCAEHAHCPVMLVRPTVEERPERESAGDGVVRGADGQVRS